MPLLRPHALRQRRGALREALGEGDVRGRVLTRRDLLEDRLMPALHRALPHRVAGIDAANGRTRELRAEALTHGTPARGVLELDVHALPAGQACFLRQPLRGARGVRFLRRRVVQAEASAEARCQQTPTEEAHYMTPSLEPK